MVVVVGGTVVVVVGGTVVGALVVVVFVVGVAGTGVGPPLRRWGSWSGGTVVVVVGGRGRGRVGAVVGAVVGVGVVEAGRAAGVLLGHDDPDERRGPAGAGRRFRSAAGCGFVPARGGPCVLIPAAPHDERTPG